MRRKVRKDLMGNMGLHSIVRSLSLDVNSSYEDDTYYYFETDTKIGEEDANLSSNDLVETFFTVRSNKEGSIEKICRKLCESLDIDELEYIFVVKKERKFNIHGIVARFRLKNVLSLGDCYRKSYGAGYLKKVGA